MSKDSGVKPVAQFYQLEIYLLSTIRASLVEGIPFIGELN